MNVATTRLKKELQLIKKNPMEHIECCPLENNIFEWHFVIHSLPYDPYKGGIYHGKIVFPPDYPYKPPGIEMITPNGRFKTNTPICMSNTNFHKESWNPLWNLDSILKGFLSFFLENDSTYGSMSTTPEEKKKLALMSSEVNLKNHIFTKLFPDMVDLSKKTIKEQEEKIVHIKEAETSTSVESSGKSVWDLTSILVLILVLIIVLYVAM